MGGTRTRGRRRSIARRRHTGREGSRVVGDGRGRWGGGLGWGVGIGSEGIEGVGGRKVDGGRMVGVEGRVVDVEDENYMVDDGHAVEEGRKELVEEVGKGCSWGLGDTERENGWDMVAIAEDHGFLVGKQDLVVFVASLEVIV